MVTRVKISVALALLTLLSSVPSARGFQLQMPTRRRAVRDRRAARPPSALPDARAGGPRREDDGRAATTPVRPSQTPRSRPPRARAGPEGEEWVAASVAYYAKVMRKHRGEALSPSLESAAEARLAFRLYHAIRQVQGGHLSRAEHIYRRTLRDIQREGEDGCSNAALATTTLLLALVLQRMGEVGEARLVFHRFFRTAMRTRRAAAASGEHEDRECACTGKVLGAYALFEMRHGSVHRSVEVARRAAQFDGQLATLFTWKQFRDARRRMARQRLVPSHWREESLVTPGEVSLFAE